MVFVILVLVLVVLGEALVIILQDHKNQHQDLATTSVITKTTPRTTNTSTRTTKTITTASSPHEDYDPPPLLLRVLQYQIIDKSL